ncbi:MAG: hypothetical protein O3A00_08985 [Planctomycetota bacterium]|nr:hypothetical protein [Planctomycetota bacterium]
MTTRRSTAIERGCKAELGTLGSGFKQTIESAKPECGRIGGTIQGWTVDSVGC